MAEIALDRTLSDMIEGFTNMRSPQGKIEHARRDGGTPTPNTIYNGRFHDLMAITDTTEQRTDVQVYPVYKMEAFGNVLEMGTSTGYSSEHATDPQPYHLTTKEYDPDAGLYYFNARWYDRHTGRFVSRDPARPFNGYVYCLSVPNCVDPTGLDPEVPGAGERFLDCVRAEIMDLWFPLGLACGALLRQLLLEVTVPKKWPGCKAFVKKLRGLGRAGGYVCGAILAGIAAGCGVGTIVGSINDASECDCDENPFGPWPGGQ